MRSLLLRQPNQCTRLFQAKFLSSSGRRQPLPPSPRVFPTTAKKDAPHDAAAKPPPSLYERTRDRGPVSWTSLFLVAVAAASAVAYYRIEREKRLERAMGQVVSSESDGWTPRPDFLAKRKFVQTRYGWFPLEDGFGARELKAFCRELDSGGPLVFPVYTHIAPP